MLEHLDEKVAKMPQSEIIEVSSNSPLAFSSDESLPLALTINWQWVLAKITEALVEKDSTGVLKLLFSDLDYVQLNHNAVEDVRSLVRQSVDENTLKTTQIHIHSLTELAKEYLARPLLNQPRLNDIIDKCSLIILQLKSLEVVGVGAFMLASGLHLALLQEQATSGTIEWGNLKKQVIEHSEYAESITPELFSLTVGLIDKSCQCIKWKVAREATVTTTQYECRYCDGIDIHLFRATSAEVETECSKHRLQRFQTMTDIVNHTAAQPVRTALRQWRNISRYRE